MFYLLNKIKCKKFYFFHFMTIIKDVNYRPFPHVCAPQSFLAPRFKRIVDIALPFISLSPFGGKAAAATLSGLNIVALTRQMVVLKKSRQWKEMVIGAMKIVVVGASAGVLLWGKGLGVLALQGFGALQEGYECLSHLYALEFKKAGLDLCQVFSSLVYVGSIVYFTPEWIVASVLLQIIKELKASFNNYKEGKYPEMVAALAMAIIRGLGSKEHICTLKRNYFGKKIGDDEWRGLLKAAQKHQSEPTKELFDAEKYLKENNFSSHVKGIDSKEKDLSDIYFKGMKFKDCQFQKVNFDRSHFEKVFFENSSFNEARFVRSIFNQVSFDHCQLNRVNAYLCQSQGLNIFNSELLRSYFNDSSLKNIYIKNSKLEGLSFLHAHVEKGRVEDSDLTNVMFCATKKDFDFKNCTRHLFTKPVVALTWNFEDEKYYASLVKEGLEQEGAIVMPFDYSPSVSVSALMNEVEAKAKKINEKSYESFISRADDFVSDIESGSQMDQLKQKAKEIHAFSHALFLSGGEDVETVFYKNKGIDHNEDFRRSLLEFFLLKDTFVNSKPLFATCRGSQITNVYLGGTLKTVGWQTGIKQFEWVGDSDEKKHIQDLLQSEQIWGFSAHHQAMDVVADRLTVIAKDGSIPKLVVHKDKPAILTQFHPEFYRDIAEYKAKIEYMFSILNDDYFENNKELIEKIVEAKGFDRKYAQEFFQNLINYGKELKLSLINVESHHKFYEDFLSKIEVHEALLPA